MSSSLKRTPYARCLILKPDPGRDWYVARTLWGDVEWEGTFKEGVALGMDHQRFVRASMTGTSSRTGAFGWADQ